MSACVPEKLPASYLWPSGLKGVEDTYFRENRSPLALREPTCKSFWPAYKPDEHMQ